ncbi:unknown [Singapore grouper iridovirus]|uniref:Uncharacterized protein n=1 Tax=Singapore grouper iridovirus TaxID=262968 RepID=Q5YFI2_9VIRU|nr:hypothetical protein ORF083R [Singapore grouper iridovirus]AAS18098.1 unknown [Singapore grouper iridovirus]WAU86792.1 hypothetical protein ORF083R [Singapore grouper iridovirus]
MLDMTMTVTLPPSLAKRRAEKKKRESPAAAKTEAASKQRSPVRKSSANALENCLTVEMRAQLEQLDREMADQERTRTQLASGTGLPLSAIPSGGAATAMSIANTMGFLDLPGQTPNFVKGLLVKCLDAFAPAQVVKPDLKHVPRGYRRLKRYAHVTPSEAAFRARKAISGWETRAKELVTGKIRATMAELAHRQLAVNPCETPESLEKTALKAYQELWSMIEDCDDKEVVKDILFDCKVLRTATRWARDFSQTVSDWYPPLLKFLSSCDYARETLSYAMTEDEINFMRGATSLRPVAGAILYGTAEDGLKFTRDGLEPFDLEVYVRRLGGMWLHHAFLPTYIHHRLFDPRPGREPVMLRTCAAYLMTEIRGDLRCWCKDPYMAGISREIRKRLLQQLSRCRFSHWGLLNYKWLKENGTIALQTLILKETAKLKDPYLSWNDVFEI